MTISLLQGTPKCCSFGFARNQPTKGTLKKRTRYPATASKVLELGYTQQPQQPQQAQGPQETGGLEDGHVSHAKPLANSCAMSPCCCFLWAVKRINCSSPSLRIPSRRIRKPTMWASALHDTLPQIRRFKRCERLITCASLSLEASGK